MSRTDKDAPHWVRSLHDPNAREHHSWRCERSSFGLARPEFRIVCDIDDTTDIRANNCSYYVTDRTRWYTGTSPSAARLHSEYFGPERASVRVELRDAVRDYNTHGDTAVEPATRQTRRSTWYGGWWD